MHTHAALQASQARVHKRARIECGHRIAVQEPQACMQGQVGTRCAPETALQAPLIDTCRALKCGSSVQQAPAMLQHNTPVMHSSQSWFASCAHTASSPNMPCIRSPIFL